MGGGAGGAGKRREKFRGLCETVSPNREVRSDMSKGMILGLLILAAFIIVLIMTRDSVTVNLFGFKQTVNAAYALLGAAGVGVVAGALLRK